ncbi:Copine-5 [Chlorella vulgaris]
MGCVNSVDDKQAVGTLKAANASSGQWQAEAAAAVAELLGPSTAVAVEVSVKCRNLRDLDTFSKSDPMCVLLEADSPAGGGARQWSEVARSDIVANNLNPDFPAPLNITYKFEQLQPMKLVVWDVDVGAKDPAAVQLASSDFLGAGAAALAVLCIDWPALVSAGKAVSLSPSVGLSQAVVPGPVLAGECEFLLSDLLTLGGKTLTIQMKDRAGRPIPGCTALLSGEELPMSNAVVSMCLGATKLDNVETFSKSDPFVRVSKMRESGTWIPVLKTEVIPNNLNPTWKPFKASMSQLCNCDVHRPLLLEASTGAGRGQGGMQGLPSIRLIVFDAEKNGNHQFIGSWQGSLQALQDAANQAQGLPLVNPKKKAGRPEYVSSGTLHVKSCSVVARPSFLDYIRGGCSLNFLVGIDFTASNGAPSDPLSLHYTGRGKSVYEKAIAAVGAVLEGYDTDKQFPAFGFGAALPPSGAANHCFPLNGMPGSPEVEGIQGILQAYRQALRQVVHSVRLSGPTLFAPIIAEAARIASQPSSSLEYFVLLILTDGCIMDMQNTVNAIVQASRLPLSLLIVGVGDEDFTSMEVLDGDEQRLKSSTGQLAARDLVQFVPFRDGDLGGGGRKRQRDAAEELASELLAELPGQLVEFYFDIMHISPPDRATAPLPPPAVAAGGFY